VCALVLDLCALVLDLDESASGRGSWESFKFGLVGDKAHPSRLTAAADNHSGPMNAGQEKSRSLWMEIAVAPNARP
jgi:hypothetical protein